LGTGIAPARTAAGGGEAGTVQRDHVQHPTGTSALLQMAVQRTQRAVHEAEAKLKLLKRWDNELDNRAAPLMKQIEQLHGFLASDMARAVAYLDQTLKALDAYRNVGATSSENGCRRTGESGGAEMNLSGNKGRLIGLTRELSLQWDETKNFWRDAKSDEFERKYMVELSAHVNRATVVLEQLEELLKKVRSECE
jgi:hypothetical protein